MNGESFDGFARALSAVGSRRRLVRALAASIAAPALLLARDDQTAADLLWSCLAEAPPGGSVDVDFIAAGQDWAIATVLEAGLALSPYGPLFTRGDLGPLRPFLPSGGFL